MQDHVSRLRAAAAVVSDLVEAHPRTLTDFAFRLLTRNTLAARDAVARAVAHEPGLLAPMPDAPISPSALGSVAGFAARRAAVAAKLRKSMTKNTRAALGRS
jgi:hypothetical protein